MKQQLIKQRGFTLIEVMITLVIVAILASVAIPSYQAYVQRSNRSDAIAPMQMLLNAQERFFLSNRQYTDDLSDLGVTLNAEGAYVVDHYDITAQQCSDTNGAAMNLNMCIELLATATGNQVDDGNIVFNTMGRSERILPDATVVDL